jgi:endo-1,4-beta-mannosidase
MRPEDIAFSVNRYDRDGDLVEKGVFLHFGETTVKAAKSAEEFRSIVRHMEAMVNEIDENHPEAA